MMLVGCKTENFAQNLFETVTICIQRKKGHNTVIF